MNIANIRAFCSFLLPRHRSTNPQIELIASIAPPILAAVALGILQRRDSGFLSTLLSIRDVSQSTQAALLVTSGLLMAGSLLRREIALFTQSSYNTLAMLAASYASVSIINAYGKGQDLPSLVLVTGFIAFSALLNTSLYLYANREKFSSTFDFSDPYNALRQLNSLIKNPTLNVSYRTTLVEARKGLIHRIFNHPELFHASLIKAGCTDEKTKGSAVVECDPDSTDPDQPLVTFCLNFLFLWFFEKQAPKHRVYALRPCRLAYINSLKVCPLEFKAHRDKIKVSFQQLKQEMMKAIQAKNITAIKSTLAYLSIPTLVVGKILSESSTVPLGVEDLERLSFPLPEDWELLYCILQNTSVKKQADWMQIKTFCKGKTTLSSEVLSTARRSVSAGSRPPASSTTETPKIPTLAGVVAGSGFSAECLDPLMGETRRRRTNPASSILDTPRGEHDRITAPVDSTTAAGTPVAPRKSRLPEGVLSTPPLSDPLAPSVGGARDSLPSARRPRAAPARATSPADPSQGGTRRRAPETPRDVPTGTTTHVEAVSTATPLHTPRAVGGAHR